MTTFGSSSGFQRAFLIGLLPNGLIVFIALLGLGDVFAICIAGGPFPCSKVVSDTIGFVKVTGPLYVAMGIILGYKRPTQVLPTVTGLGLPLLLVGILMTASGLMQFRSAAGEWLVVNTMIFGIPPLAAAVGALIGARLKLRRPSKIA